MVTTTLGEEVEVGRGSGDGWIKCTDERMQAANTMSLLLVEQEEQPCTFMARIIAPTRKLHCNTVSMGKYVKNKM